MTGDLLKIELRNGTTYTSTGGTEFLQPLLDEFQEDYPDLPVLLRGDSGFAKPELYEQCETNGVSYVIRLKENNILRGLAADIDEALTEGHGILCRKLWRIHVSGRIMEISPAGCMQSGETGGSIDPHVYIHCYKHGFFAGGAHSLLLQTGYHGELHKRKQKRI